VNAKSSILARIRAAQRGGAARTAAEPAAAERYLAAHAPGPRPAARRDPLEGFIERAQSLSTTVERVARAADVPQAVARYLGEYRLPLQAVCWPEWAALDWRGAGIAVGPRPASGDDLVGITGAFCAIAETGTLMLLSGAATPGTTSLLPETHIALVAESRIVRGMEDAWALLRAERGDTTMPRAVNFISGPSRTADIEQTLVLGAHGPYRVHIILTPA
jgi:L-lactate dehydrogenase complex protein LldG